MNTDTTENATGSLLGKFIKEVNKISLLTREEEIALGKKIQNGDKEALNTLVKHNIRWVVSLSFKYIGRGISQEDLIQEGISASGVKNNDDTGGLIRAAEKFDPESGYRFSTYATEWIKQAMSRSIMNKAKTIRTPVHIYNDTTLYLRTAKKIETMRRLDSNPVILTASIADIAKDSGHSENRVKTALTAYNGAAISGDAPVGQSDENTETTILDAVPNNTPLPEELIEQEETLSALSAAFNGLDKIEIKAVKMLFGIPPYNDKRTIEDICEEFDCSDYMIKKIQRSAFEKIREELDILHSLDKNDVRELALVP